MPIIGAGPKCDAREVLSLSVVLAQSFHITILYVTKSLFINNENDTHTKFVIAQAFVATSRPPKIFGRYVGMFDFFHYSNLY